MMPGFSRICHCHRASRACAVAAGLLLAVTAMPASADTIMLTAQPRPEASQTSIEQIEDWQVTCNRVDDSQTCGMTATGAAQTPDGRTIRVGLSQLRITREGKALFAVETPLDLLLSKGIEMRVDGGPLMRLAYRSCHADGCLAPFSMNSGLALQFRKGNQLELRIFDLQGKPVDVRFSLLGFTAAGKLTGI